MKQSGNKTDWYLIVPWINIAVAHQTPTVIVVSMESLDTAGDNRVVNVKNIGKKRLGWNLKVDESFINFQLE